MKETVLVSGGAGYIGSHVAVELSQAGYGVVIVDNLSNSELAAVEGVRQITGMDIPFEQVNHLKLNYKIVGRRAGDVPSVWADTSLANKELGWKAGRTLEQTLEAAWNWEKKVRNIK